VVHKGVGLLSSHLSLVIDLASDPLLPEQTSLVI